jgi:hypothetical protein
MGLQTGLVSIVSGGLIKSTSLASLFTDLGSEVAEYYYLGTKKDREIRNRIYVRLTVLAFYFIGGLVGGFFFNTSLRGTKQSPDRQTHAKRLSIVLRLLRTSQL